MTPRPYKRPSKRPIHSTCPIDGKQLYETRKDAKQDLARNHPGSGMSVYPCGDGFHYGHLSARVKAGDVDRATHRANNPPCKHEWERIVDPEHLGIGATFGEKCRLCGVSRK